MKHGARTLMIDGEQWVGIPEAAHLVDRTTRTIRRWRDAGWIRIHRPEHHVYVHVADLEATNRDLLDGRIPEVRRRRT